MPTASEALARVANELRYEDLPHEVVSKVKSHVLDLIGVAAAAAPLDFGVAAKQVAAGFGGAPTCTVIGTGERMPGV
ncbi:MAG TPA: MmgE/PrpD family protein, partial [Candidatus Acidoferrales bacterium]|nr:MmgE/PrpD family protein [Candidatus Acidoferrales bacterium]